MNTTCLTFTPTRWTDRSTRCFANLNITKTYRILIYSISNTLTCEQINGRSHFCWHGTCNWPVRQSPHVPTHLCLQASIVLQGLGQGNRFNSDGDETIQHGTSTAWSQGRRFRIGCLQSLIVGVRAHWNCIVWPHVGTVFSTRIRHGSCWFGVGIWHRFVHLWPHDKTSVHFLRQIISLCLNTRKHKFW